MHSLLDLYGSAVAALPSSSSSTHITPISPATPASPSEALSTDSMLLDARNPNASRKLSSLVYSPPPFGVLFWCNYATRLTAADMLNELTQIKIALRRLEEERDGRETLEKAVLLRAFDIGGVKGDINREIDETVEMAWLEREKEKQYSALQRYLF